MIWQFVPYLPYYFVGFDTSDMPAATDYDTYRNVRGNHSSLILKIGGDAIALLKNDNTNGGGLSLNRPHSISLYGAHAGPAMAGKSQSPPGGFTGANNYSSGPNFGWSVQGTDADIFQGHPVSGGGSGQLSLPHLVTPFQSLTQLAMDDDSMIWWIMNNSKRVPRSHYGKK